MQITTTETMTPFGSTTTTRETTSTLCTTTTTRKPEQTANPGYVAEVTSIPETTTG